MAVLIVYARKHWMDDSTTAIPADKYARRYQRGDLFDVKDDAECPEAPGPGSAFVFIRITRNDGSEFPAEKLRAYAEEQIDSETGETISRRRFHLNWAEIPPAILGTLKDAREIKVTIGQVLSNLSLWDKIRIADDEQLVTLSDVE